MESIKFSILIPVYNVENFLRECIDSILDQSYKNFEVILINDGSTDLSGEICNEYLEKDKRVRVFSQINQGHIIARRRALSEAKGDFYLFLDSDDYWDVDLLKEVNQVILEEKCDLVIFRYKRVSEKNEYISQSKTLFSDKTIFNNANKTLLFKEIIKGSDLNNLVCKVVKSTLIENTNYLKYNDIKNAEDLLQSLPIMYKCEKAIYIDRPIYNYRVTSNSITQTFNINRYKDVTIVRSIVLKYIYKLEMNTEENLKIFYEFYIMAILRYINELMIFNVNIEEKKRILLEIKDTELFTAGINYYDNNNLKLEYRITMYFLNNNYYNLLYIFSVSLFQLKRGIRFLYLKKKGK